MTINMTSSHSEPTISAVQARKRFGELLDTSFYRSRSFRVERAGKFMVAIIPASEFEDLQRLKREARERFFGVTDDIRTQVAQSGVTDAELQADIDDAVREVRAETALTTSRNA